MDTVFLVIAEHIQLEASPGAGIKGVAIGCEIERDLDEVAVVLEAYVPHLGSTPVTSEPLIRCVRRPDRTPQSRPTH